MELCRWFENLPSDFTLVCVAKPKPWWNSFGLFVGNTDAILVFQTFLYRKLSPVKTAFAQSTKCRVRLWPTKMSSSVRYYYFFVVWLYVFGVGFFLLLHEVHWVLLWSAAPITCTHVWRVCACLSSFLIHANCKCSQPVSMQQWATGSCSQWGCSSRF